MKIKVGVDWFSNLRNLGQEGMNKHLQPIFRGGTAALLTVLLALGACQDASPASEPEDPTALSDLQAAVATYLYLPDFAHPEFPEQVLGLEVESLGYTVMDRMVYLGVDKGMAADSAVFARICTDPSQIEIAKGYQLVDWLGPDPDRDADTSRLAFRFPIQLLRLDSTRRLLRQYPDVEFTLSLGELSRCFRLRYAYHAPALALAPGPAGRSYIIANHAAPISRPGDPVLQRFVERLLPAALPTREDSAQALLDFVTTDIHYTHHGDLEIFMRPSDVLLSGKADCSGKVILYASLLEQIDLPYLLVYLEGHIAVAVAGDFPEDNDMHFDHEGTRYTLAETTAEGFRIGESELMDKMNTWDYRYLQRPGKTAKLFDLWRNDSLEFAVRAELSNYRAPLVK